MRIRLGFLPIRNLLSVLVLLFLNPSFCYSCSCIEPDEWGFLSEGVLPSNAKGVLFWSRANINITSPFVESVDQIPPPIHSKLFTISDLSAKKDVPLRVVRLSSGDVFSFHSRRYLFEGMSSLGCDRHSKDEICRDLNDYNSSHKRLIDSLLAQKKVTDITEKFDAGAGLFRIEPISGFVSGHRYKISAKHPTGRESYDSRYKKYAAGENVWSTEVTIDARELTVEARRGVKLKVFSEPTVIKPKRGGMCSTLDVHHDSGIQVFSTEFVLEDAKLFANSMRTALYYSGFVDRYSISNFLPSIGAYKLWLYTESVCSWIGFGKADGPKLVDILYRPLELEGLAEKKITLRGRYGFFEVEDRWYEADDLQMTLPEVRALKVSR